MAGMLGGDRHYSEAYDLELNCSMQRAQLKVTLTPKFRTLRRLTLVVTCAPSLEICYVFEVVTQHRLRDFGEFDSVGSESVQRWYKYAWNLDAAGLVERIATKLEELVREHVQATEQRLAKDKT